MIVYKGFGHASTSQAAARSNGHNYEWFSRWIWGEKPAQEGKWVKLSLH